MLGGHTITQKSRRKSALLVAVDLKFKLNLEKQDDNRTYMKDERAARTHDVEDPRHDPPYSEGRAPHSIDLRRRESQQARLAGLEESSFVRLICGPVVAPTCRQGYSCVGAQNVVMRTRLHAFTHHQKLNT